MQISSIRHLLFFFILISFLRILKKRILRKSCADLPPGPPKLPLIGNLHSLIGCALPHRKFHSLAKIYGPLLWLKLGQINFIVISSAELACEVMKTQDLNFASRPKIAVTKILCNGREGIVVSPYGSYWRELRKICTMELLSTKRVKSYSFIREEEGRKLVERVRDMTEKESVVNLSKMLLSSANTMVVRASFGKDLAEQGRFLRVMKEVLQLSHGFLWVDLFPTLGFLNGIGGANSRMKRLWKEMDAILSDVMRYHKDRRGAVAEDEKESLIEVLLRITANGDMVKEFSEDHMKAVIIDMFIAGTETSASLMAWGMAELIKHPDTMKRLQLEIRGVMEGKEKVEESDLEKMPYLKQVIKETLRLHPPVPLLLPRLCHETTKISGLAIPAGSKVLVNAWAIGRDPGSWKEPESFRPERFEENDTDFKGADFEFIPFGAGRRICPGAMFGLAFVELWIADLLYYFDWKVPGGRKNEELDMDEDFNLTVTRKNDLYLMATPRYPFK